jgi:hypothetical protein
MSKIKIEKSKLLEMIQSVVEQLDTETPISDHREKFEKPTVEMTKKELYEMVTAVLENSLPGAQAVVGNPIMAKREIISMMDTTSRGFEREILKIFDLKDPDTLTPELQKRYLLIVEQMKSELVAAAMEAVKQLIGFPKNNETRK